MTELRPGLLFAHYRLERKLAFGGMGDVYLAKDERAGNAPVALKILQRDRAADERRVRAFHEEGELAERMDHSNLLQVVIGVDINSKCQPVIGALNPEKTLDGLSLKRAVSNGQRGPQFCFRDSQRYYSEFHLFSSELIAPQLGGTVAP